MSPRTIGHTFIGTQRENGGHHTFMDLPSLDFTVSCRFPRVQESPSELRICSEAPESESAQELRSTVNVAFVITLDPSVFPATDSFLAVS